jgi:hypothetical protein
MLSGDRGKLSVDVWIRRDDELQDWINWRTYLLGGGIPAELFAEQGEGFHQVAVLLESGINPEVFL